MLHVIEWLTFPIFALSFSMVLAKEMPKKTATSVMLLAAIMLTVVYLAVIFCLGETIIVAVNS